MMSDASSITSTLARNSLSTTQCYRYLNLRAHPRYRNEHSSTTSFTNLYTHRESSAPADTREPSDERKLPNTTNPAPLRTLEPLRLAFLASVPLSKYPTTNKRVTVRYACGAQYSEPDTHHLPHRNTSTITTNDAKAHPPAHSGVIELPRPCGDDTCLQKWTLNLRAALQTLQDRYLALGVRFFCLPLVDASDPSSLSDVRDGDAETLAGVFASLRPPDAAGNASPPTHVAQPDVPPEKFVILLEYLQTAGHLLVRLPGYEAGVRDARRECMEYSRDVKKVVEQLKRAEEWRREWSAELDGVAAAIERVHKGSMRVEESVGGRVIRQKRARCWLARVPWVMAGREESLEEICASFFSGTGLFECSTEYGVTVKALEGELQEIAEGD